MSGLEARGREAEVSARREVERTLRQEAALRQSEHQELVAELREVTREEVAGQRSAARERRLCVAVNDYAGIYGKAGDYRIAKDY